MLESRNVDNMKVNCSWDIFLWKNYGGHRNFKYFKIISTLYPC